MIIIAWLILVLMTTVDAAAHAPSPANIAPARNLGGSSADDATYRSLRVSPERFRENPRWRAGMEKAFRGVTIIALVSHTQGGER
jgi:hypothetical protein